MHTRNTIPNRTVWVDDGKRGMFCVNLAIHDVKVDIGCPINKRPTLCTIQVRYESKIVLNLDSNSPAWANSAYLILRLLSENAGMYGSSR